MSLRRCRFAGWPGPVRRLVLALLAACAAALPLTTHSHTIDHLLQLPLERLLQTEYGGGHHGR
jgi:hypothetical protein